MRGKDRAIWPLKTIARQLKSIPDDADAYAYRGFAYELKRNFEKAIKDYNKAIDIESGSCRCLRLPCTGL